MVNRKRVEIIEHKPHKVTYKSLEDGNIYEVPRGYFRRRWNMGFYEVVNDHAIPLY